jgi:aryl-alcohol dehydrogenase-like predicted oxidoreductase
MQRIDDAYNGYALEQFAPRPHHRRRSTKEILMRYKLLGRSGLRVSELALGTMTFGEEWGFGAPREECRRMFDAFVEAGGNFIDTANKYTDGSAERIVGELVAAERDRFVVATKYTLSMRAGDPNASGNHRKNMHRSVEASLQRLGTDHLDVLWVHAWDFTTPVDEVMRGLDDLVRAGKVLYVGISDAPAWVVAQGNTLADLRGWSRFVGLQVEYSLIERTAERELLPMARALGVGVTGWAPIAGGILSGKFTRAGAASADTRRAGANAGRMDERGLAIARAVDRVADELDLTSAQVAIAWVRQRDGGQGIIPIVGARTSGQLIESLRAADVILPAEHRATLDQASEISLGFPHEFLASPMARQVVFGDTDG